MTIQRPSYMDDRYVVVIGNHSTIAPGIVEQYLDVVKKFGYIGVAIYIHESFFPATINEHGVNVPDFDKIYDNHKIGEFQRRLDLTSPNYVDPYSLVRSDIKDMFRNIEISHIFSVLFDGRKTPWTDVEIQQIFTEGSISASVHDISEEASSPAG